MAKSTHVLLQNTRGTNQLELIQQSTFWNNCELFYVTISHNYIIQISKKSHDIVCITFSPMILLSRKKNIILQAQGQFSCKLWRATFSPSESSMVKSADGVSSHSIHRICTVPLLYTGCILYGHSVLGTSFFLCSFVGVIINTRSPILYS